MVPHPSYSLLCASIVSAPRRISRSGRGAIQELAGHADLTTTQRYMHLSPAATEDAIWLLDGRQAGLETVEKSGDILDTVCKPVATSDVNKTGWTARCMHPALQAQAVAATHVYRSASSWTSSRFACTKRGGSWCLCCWALFRKPPQSCDSRTHRRERNANGRSLPGHLSDRSEPMTAAGAGHAAARGLTGRPAW